MKHLSLIWFWLMAVGPVLGQEATRSVATVRDLLALTPATIRPDPAGGLEATALVQGRLKPNDGSGGLFRWDPTSLAATNRGRIFAVPGVLTGRWERVISGATFDARWYGAAPTASSAENVMAINAAVEDCRTNSRALLLPAGIYRVDDTVIAMASTGNSMDFSGIVGEGMGKTILERTDSKGPALRIGGRGMTYSGFSVRFHSQPALTDTEAIGIEIKGWLYFSTLQDLEVTKCYTGIKSVPDPAEEGREGLFSSTVNNVYVRHCLFRDVDWLTSSGSRIDNMYLSNNGIDAIESYMLFERSGASIYGQLNLEHSNLRSTPLRLDSENTSIKHLHMEGLRTIGGDAGFMSAGMDSVAIESAEIVNCWVNGQILSGITFSGNVATATVDNLGAAMNSGHGFRVGDRVTVAGASDPLYNGTFAVKSITSTSFSYTMSGSPAQSAVPDYAGSRSYIRAYLGSFPATAVIVPSPSYEGGKIHIGHLKIRNLHQIGETSANREFFSVARDFGGHPYVANIDEVSLGSAYWAGSRYQAQPAVVALAKLGNTVTAWTREAHQLKKGDSILLASKLPAFYTSRAHVTGTPDNYRFTYVLPGGDVSLTNFNSGVPYAVITAMITNKARTGNVATVTTDAPHNMSAGTKCFVSLMSDPSFNEAETAVIAVPAANQFQYANPGEDLMAAPEIGGSVTDLDCGLMTNLIPVGTTSLRTLGRFSRAIACVHDAHLGGGAEDRTFTVPMSLARPGDMATVASYSSNLPAGVIVSGFVSSPGVVTLVIRNTTSGSVVVPATVVAVYLQKP